MNAVVKYGQMDGMVELRDVPIPEIGPQDVLLEVRAAGVCGSDIEMYRHKVSFPVNTPVIQGHEFAGVIAEVGDGVEGGGFLDSDDEVVGALSGGAAGAVGDGDEGGAELFEVGDGLVEVIGGLVGLGGEELEGEGGFVVGEDV